MKRSRRWFRLWLGSALGVASLAFASSASAMVTFEAGGHGAPQAAAGSGSGSAFDWQLVAVVVVVSVVVAAALGLAYIARNHGRLAPSA